MVEIGRKQRKIDFTDPIIRRIHKLYYLGEPFDILDYAYKSK